MKKTICSILVSVVLALAILLVLPNGANAATEQENGNAILAEVLKQDGTFPESLDEGKTTYTAKCHVCGTDKEWEPMAFETKPTLVNGGHYYLPTDRAYLGQIFAVTDTVKTVCLHTNGKVLTDTSYRIARITTGCTFNIMGGGTIKCNTSGQRGILYSAGGTVNVYGTALESTATTVAEIGNAVLAQYSSTCKANFWGCTLTADKDISPAILTNGTVKLYNCTVNGTVETGNYAGQDGSKASLLLADTGVTQGVNWVDGALSVSGKTTVGGAGLELPEGKTIDPSQLTTGASIAIATKGAFTESGMESYADFFKPVGNNCMISADETGVLRCWPTGAALVKADGTEVSPDDVLTAWATGDYAYIKLYGDESLVLNGQNIVIDLGGFDLTVTGNGKISAFDSANDTYRSEACGTILYNGEITFTQVVDAPNGNRYVVVIDGNRVTAHRLDMKLTAVSLRTTVAGLYYKATYNCDAVLAKKVQAYGVIASLNNMPGADFANDGTDINRYSTIRSSFHSGVVATSGSVFGIMKESKMPLVNEKHAKMPIYANAYIDFGNGPIVADTVNPGKKVGDEGFDGVAMSLYDVMLELDKRYSGYNTATRLQLDAFYQQWKPLGMFWEYENIGQSADSTGVVDNSDIELQFDEGTTNAQCPVCKEKVTWSPLSDETTTHNLKGHYYLTKDLTYTGTATAFIYNGTSQSTLCLHLNGHDLTATKTLVFFGSSGRANIMGNGEVSGANRGTGAAVQLNNGAANNGIFIYGGTWKKDSTVPATTAVLGIHSNGGLLRVYAGATIDAPVGLAIKAMKPTSAKNAELGVYGATLNGGVQILGGDPVKGYTSDVELVDCAINGDVNVAENTDVYLAGELKIQSVTLAKKVFLNAQVLSTGTSIGITNDGIFTQQNESVKNYVGYFHGMDPAAKITVRDNALYCGPDYTGKLQFTEGTNNAVCPVCREEVTWTPVDGSAVINNTARVEQHYYLTNDVVFNSETAVSSFLTPGHGDFNVCFHLNGHDFTGNTRFVFGGTSVTNVMGSGTVTGSRNDAYAYGSTIQINTSGAAGAVNLYGGTWTQAENCTNADDYVIYIGDNGGTVNVHEGATVKANSNGKAVYVGKCALRNSAFGVYSGNVIGEVKAVGADPEKGFASTVTVDNGSIDGTLDINGVNTVTVAKGVKIGLLDMEATSLIDMVELTLDTNITVANTGMFTNAHEDAAVYADYFHPYNEVDRIVVRDSALQCKTDFTAKLYPDADGNAYCPVCRISVQWTAVSSADEKVTFTNGGHYYLTKDLTYSGTEYGFLVAGGSGTVTCLHLNGNDVTATATKAIYGGSGKLNVMGSGVVSGYCVDKNAGAAVHTNNTVATNGINLYGGTYKKYNNSENAAVIAAYDNGGTINLYDGATVQNSTGVSIYLGKAEMRNTQLGIYGATVTGGTITVSGAKTETYTSTIILEDALILGTVDVAVNNAVSISRATQISKLNLAEGVIVDFTELRDGTDIAVSATGDFSTKLDLAETWLDYFTCADEGQWNVVRFGKFHQTDKPVMAPAAEADVTVLDNAYAGTEVRYGEMHNHTNDGPTDKTYGSGADGKFSYEEWIAKMDEFHMSFATIVNHSMSLHMYQDQFEYFRPDYFVGGTEPGTRITTYDFQNNMHYNMIFDDPANLEAVVYKWENKFKPRVGKDGYDLGIRFANPDWTKEEFTQLAKDVYEYGGLLVHVHPRANHNYIVSDDPLDYYFADYTGFEISTGEMGTMASKYNEEAYQVWVDLLELGKKVWATSGSDYHRITDTSALTTMYTVNRDRTEYFANMYTGNFAPGWVGIRMNIGDTVMGGETDFTGKRLQFSVGDIYAYEVKDDNNKQPAYVKGHTYRVELYDDGGLLMETTIDPTQTSYFAIDCDEDAMFYRVVVRDVTDNERVGVSNPIWNVTE